MAQMILSQPANSKRVLNKCIKISHMHLHRHIRTQTFASSPHPQSLLLKLGSDSPPRSLSKFPPMHQEIGLFDVICSQP